MDYSVYKLNACCDVVRKMHIYDALNAIQNVQKKGGQIVKSVLEAARVNGTKKGLAEERMFVKEIVLGKALGPRKLDIKARGKMGIIRSNISSISITLEEKSMPDFFKMMMVGKCPPAIGLIFRKMLYQNEADFEQIKELSYLTTSQGRYYRKQQFKRLVQLIQKEYQKQGIDMKKDKITRNILEKAAQQFTQIKKQSDEEAMLTNRTLR